MLSANNISFFFLSCPLTATIPSTRPGLLWSVSQKGKFVQQFLLDLSPKKIVSAFFSPDYDAPILSTLRMDRVEGTGTPC